MTNSQLKALSKLVPSLRRHIIEQEKALEQLQTELNIANKNYQRLETRIANKAALKVEPIWPLLKEDLLKVNFDKVANEKAGKKHPKPLKFNWVVVGVSLASGGQGDIFRTIEHLANSGHDCHVYFYDVRQNSNLDDQRNLIKSRFPNLHATYSYNAKTMRDCDALFATHWVTAYPVYNFQGSGKKYYYIQDFEPYFEPAGYLNYLSERTYSFGFKGLTLGSWLSEKIHNEYGMQCMPFDFGYDPRHYFLITNTKRTKDVLYYIRPNTPRRGVELALMALEIFHGLHPESKIHLFGSDIKNFKIPFPYIDHGILNIQQLNDLYNHCAAGIILSFTNMSLIPLEMIASGCVPVVNDSYHTRKVKYKDSIVYAKLEPKAMAKALSKTLESKSGVKKGTDDPSKYHWEKSNELIEEILVRDLST